MKRVNILAIGNSFSEDATAYLQKISASAGVDIKVVSLYIGGCSIATHAQNIRQNNAAYAYQLDGVVTQRMISIDEALEEENWDFITVQQASHDSGIFDTYADGPFLVEHIRKLCPQSQIYFHKTWSYEYCSEHSEFYRYAFSPAVMDKAITETVDRFCRENGGLPQIPVGDVITALKKLPMFDSEHGGQSLYRDGFHMHLIYGRYAAAATWFQILLGDLAQADFYPRYPDVINGYEAQLPADFVTDETMIQKIRETVKNVCKEKTV